MRFHETSIFRNLITAVVSIGSATAVILFLAHPIFSNAQGLRGHDEKSMPPPWEEAAEKAQGEPAMKQPGEESVMEGQPAASIEPGLEAQRSVSAEPLDAPQAHVSFSVAGQLYDLDTGDPLTNRPFTVQAWAPGSGFGPLEAEVDTRTGEFLFSGLPPGPSGFAVSAKDYLPVFGDFWAPMDGRLLLGMTRGGAVRIRATDAYARKLRDVRIWIPSGPESLVTEPVLQTVEDGLYRVSGLREGVQDLHLEAPGFDRMVLTVRVSRAEEHTYWALFE